MGLWTKKQNTVAVRTVELNQPLQPLTDVLDFTRVRIFVAKDGRILGSLDIVNQGRPISVSRLRRSIADNLTFQVIESEHNLSHNLLWSTLEAALAERYAVAEAKDAPPNWLVDLSRPLRPLIEASQYTHVRVTVTWQDQPLGNVEIANHCQPVSVTRLREAIADSLGLQLLEQGQILGKDALWGTTVATLTRHYLPKGIVAEPRIEQLSPDVPVSVVVATLDRPDDLRQCLQSLVAQVSPRSIEIVVVDNNPASGLTPPVVAEFPKVILVNEPRKGLAYARNAGFVASTGDIAIATDDDVVAPSDWVERLVAPFARNDVMVVTGNVLPMELETPAQQFFELYGGLGRGFKHFEVNREWFESFRFRAVPTWQLGATANAAFRTIIFTHPRIGLMEESLGPGMPSGVGEDTYLFYKVLKAGYTIVYEPEAYVWHKHRRTMAALRRQLYNYSKGGIAYHLTTLCNDGDWRGLVRIMAELPLLYKWRINEWLHRRNTYPMSLLLLEVWGNLIGFWTLWQSWQRVKHEGRSNSYIPISQRRRTGYVLPQ